MLVGNVHFVAGRTNLFEKVFDLLRQEGVEPQGNPDVYIRQFGNFGIDEARELSTKAAMRAVGGGRRYFVITVDAMTLEAQNALLKTLEDPPGDAVFIFIHPVPQTLLPTVRSRAQIMHLGVNAEASDVNAEQFLKAAPAKRLDMLKPLLEKGDDDKRDMGEILGFLGALEREVQKGMNGKEKEKGERLHAVYRARRYIGDRGALVKPLLEQVALLL
ncbi:hypothetical protein C4568_00980 [Candidatus Parcubacteria bacterium]|nr:MAG: hypothetical protein C4568_00980 [Candidatus Parcubacteria bacterium]